MLRENHIYNGKMDNSCSVCFAVIFSLIVIKEKMNPLIIL